MAQAIKSGPRWDKIETTGFRGLGGPLLVSRCIISMAAHLSFLKENHYSLCLCIPSLKQNQAFQDFSIVQDNKEVYQVSNHLSNWPAGWGGGWTVALLRGVRAGWMGRIPGFGWVCPALGLWRGAMEVSVVGMGSVSLEKEKKKQRFMLKCGE